MSDISVDAVASPLLSKRDPLLQLAERCERGEVGFDIEKEILRALGFTWRGMAYWSSDDRRTWKGGTNFTRSLDAAVTLVPHSAIWSVHGAIASKGFADVSTMQEPHYFKADAATPALALCAVALRARALEAK